MQTELACFVMQLEEWDKQLHRSQQNMRELAGSDPNALLHFDVGGSEDDTQSEAMSQAQGMRPCRQANLSIP